MGAETARGVYVQVEGINLGSHVFDTDRLSVVRGSSLLLKAGITEIGNRFGERLEPLSIGASRGLFRYLGKGPDALGGALALCDEIGGHLGTSPKFQNTDGDPPDFSALTFVAVCCQADSLPQARERLLALVRFAQLRQISVAPDPHPHQAPSSCRPCAVVPQRQAYPAETLKNPFRRGDTSGNDWVSRSLYRRWRHGRLARTRLYTDTAQASAPDLGFTQSFEELATCKAFGALSRKLAVLYFDGNGFGKIERQAAQSPGGLRDFDQALRGCRDAVLTALVGALDIGRYGAGSLPETTVTTEGERRLRLETLLWGGDEMTLVVPAWLGLDVMHLVFDAWTQATESEAGVAAGLAGTTHAAGLVFCHHKSPIARVRAEAQRLAEGVKAWAGRDGNDPGAGRRRNLFDYLVLESIDYPTERDLGAFFQRRYGALGAHRFPLTPDAAWWREGEGKAQVAALRSAPGLSRAGVYRLARTLVSIDLGQLAPSSTCGRSPPPWDLPPDSEPTPGFAAFEARVFQTMARAEATSEMDEPSDAAAAALTRLAGVLGIDLEDTLARGWLWLHLAELWDYLAPQPTDDSQGGTDHAAA